MEQREADWSSPVKLWSPEKNSLPSVLRVPDNSSQERSFLDISIKKFRTVVDPAFQDADYIYSKEGWLLLCHVDRQLPCQHAFFLVNPRSGDRVDLPIFEERVLGPFTFSVVSGAPDRIIHVDYHHPFYISIRVASPGDHVWEVHRFRMCDRRTLIYAAMLIGVQVLCFAMDGKMVAFNLSDKSWLYFTHLQNSARGYQYLAEFEGGLVKLVAPPPCYSSFNFWRLDERRMDWLELDELELENTSWFMGRPQSFCVKGEGKKVYTLLPNEYDGPTPPKLEPGKRRRVIRGIPLGGDISVNVYIHDMEDGSTDCLLPDSFPSKVLHWVDVDPSLLG